MSLKLWISGLPLPDDKFKLLGLEEDAISVVGQSKLKSRADSFQRKPSA